MFDFISTLGIYTVHVSLLGAQVLRSIHWYRKIEVREGVEEKALKEKEEEEVWA